MGYRSDVRIITTRYARIGEDYEDYENDFYDSKRENETKLDFLCPVREFDEGMFDYLEEVDEKIVQENEEINDRDFMVKDIEEEEEQK